MSKVFYLPDLGEGLPDAEIVEWHVKEGDTVALDQALVSMETAKAVVDVPSPFSGKVTKLHGKAGDVILTHAALATFELDANAPQRADAQDTGHHQPAAKPPADTAAPPSPQTAASNKPAAREDSGTVVGQMESSNQVLAPQTTTVGGVKAMPAVRALAKKLGLDISQIQATGAEGSVSLSDVKNFAASPAARQSPVQSGAAAASSRPAQAPVSNSSSTLRVATPNSPAAGEVRSLAGKPVRTVPPSVQAYGQPEALRGVRKNMARVMADSHANVVPTTIVDDADIYAWLPGNDITVRVIRAIVSAARNVPALNAWFDGAALTRTMHERVDIGIAVDTDDGLFVPALRNAETLDGAGIRAGINRLREQVQNRSIAADDLKNHTIVLSNFGVFAGRYATPVVVPPCIAILGTGKLRHELVPVMGGVETHRLLPLSLTFDHRAATGGEAARFLKALLDDLALPS